jgi:pimeloyl-ACP methyl ester carboxylesterase
MKLLFFGDSNRQLFGAYHAPSSSAPARGAALLCPPWGPEYFSCHRILRGLASRLSDAGFHVLRFDYYGTGDSAGEREDGNLDTWYEDAALAMAELRDMSGCDKLTLVGVRLGAVVGWRLARAHDNVGQLVMWDPVADGSGYVRELLETQEKVDRWSLSKAPPRPAGDLALDLLGYPLTASMRSSIEAVTIQEFARPSKASVLLFQSSSSPDGAALQQAFQAGGTRALVESVPDHTVWLESDGLGVGALPHATLVRMVELIQ